MPGKSRRFCVLTTTICTMWFPFAASAQATAEASQSTAPRSGEQIKAALSAHAGEFDYLLGDWEFTGVNRDGRFHGRWSAVRVPGTGQILDEFRVLSDSDQTLYLTTTWTRGRRITKTLW